MTVIVSGALDAALQNLNRKMKIDGIVRELKIHQIPKRSSRRKFKAFLAERRRVRDQRRGRRAGASS